jgi:hypothetical protein
MLTENAVRRAHRQPQLFREARHRNRFIRLGQALDHPDASHDRALDGIAVSLRVSHIFIFH